MVKECEYDLRVSGIAIQRAFRQSFSSSLRQIRQEGINLCDHFKERRQPEDAPFSPMPLEWRTNPVSGRRELFWRGYGHSIERSHWRALALARLHGESKEEVEALRAQARKWRGIEDKTQNLEPGQAINYLVPKEINPSQGVSFAQIVNIDGQLYQQFQLLPFRNKGEIGKFERMVGQERERVEVGKKDNLSPLLSWVVSGRPVDFEKELPNFINTAKQLTHERLQVLDQSQVTQPFKEIPIFPATPTLSVPLSAGIDSLPTSAVSMIQFIDTKVIFATALHSPVANDNDNPVSHVLSESASMFKILSLPNSVQINELFPKTAVLPAVDFIPSAERDMIKPYPNIQTFDRVREQIEVIIPQIAPYQPLTECSYVPIYERSSGGQVVEQKNVVTERPVNFKEIPIFKPQIKAEQEYQIVYETAKEIITTSLVEMPATADNQIGKMLEVEAEIMDEDEMGKMLSIKPGLRFYDQPALNEQTVVRPQIKTEDRSEEQDKLAVGKKVKVLAIKRLVVKSSLDLSSAKPDVVGVRLEIKKLIWVNQSDRASFPDILELELPKDQNQRLYSLLHFLRKLVKEKLGEDFLWQWRIKVMNADGPADDLTETSGDLEDFQEIEYYFSLLQERGNYAQVFAFAN